MPGAKPVKQEAAIQEPPSSPQAEDSRSKVHDSPAETKVNDRETALETVVELLESARYKTHNEDRAGGVADYRRAGQLAAEFRAKYAELTRQERRVGSIVSFFLARTLAEGEEPASAFDAIRQAFELGFEDLERVDTDGELSKLRALPEFAGFRAELDQQLTERTHAEIKHKLASVEPYALDFRLPDLDQQEVALAEFRDKIVVLAFWGTWCIKCQAEIPSLVKLQEDYGPQGLQVIGLTYEDAESTEQAVQQIRKFLETHPVNYPCLLGDEAIRDQVRPPDDAPPEWVFPVTLLLDRAGNVRLHFDGAVSYGKLSAAAQALLAAGNSAR